MLVVLNLLIILFVLAMMLIWATYGLFSSFLHLVIVIVSGVLAFAMWEPLAYMLLDRMPAYAWGVALLAPFCLTLIIVRGLMDKFCRKNLHFPALADQIGGGAVGVVSGMLSLGVLIIGFGFMPVTPDLMGYQPYRMAGNDIEDNADDGGMVWLPVHKVAGGFFSMLSKGSMHPSLSESSLAVNKADVAKRASTFRLQDDPNQMKTAAPDGVKVLDLYTFTGDVADLQPIMKLAALMSVMNPEYQKEIPEINEIDLIDEYVQETVAEIARRYAESDKPSTMIDPIAVQEAAKRLEIEKPGEDFEAFFDALAEERTDEMIESLEGKLGSGKRLFIVDTVWNSDSPGTYNTDGWLRVALPQIRLQTVSPTGDYKLHPPAAYSLETNKLSGDRAVVNLLAQQTYAVYAQDSPVKISWMFMLPDSAKAYRFEARQLGFDLTDVDQVKTKPVELAKVIGAAFLEEPEEDDGEKTADNTQNRDGTYIGNTEAYAQVTERLPKALSPNSATAITPNKDSEQWTAFEGEQSISSGAGGGGRQSRMQNIYVPSGSRLLRIKMDSNSAQSLYGQARQAAANLQVMKIRDTTGNMHDAVAYVLFRKDSSMEVAIRKINGAPMTSLRANQLPRPGPNDELYVYFQVPVGRTLNGFMLGTQTEAFQEQLEVTQN